MMLKRQDAFYYEEVPDKFTNEEGEGVAAIKVGGDDDVIADDDNKSKSDSDENDSSSDEAEQQSNFSVASYTFRPCSVDLRFSNVGYSVKINRKENKTILHDLSGTFEPGKLHGIMGPSGSGKTSLLNVLAGFNQTTRGEISVNGDKIPANNCSAMMSAISSYIMQHDFLLGELTTRETLAFAAKLKLPPGVDKKKQEQLVNDLLKRMALVDMAKTAIWKLSGGQKKRVAVAVELINYGPVIFLDEPTSGLDSTSCYRLIELLKKVANVGCNVIATIHQPNSRVFRMFDSLYVLAEGGKLAYSGSPLGLTHSLSLIGVKCGEFENPANLLFERGNITKLAHKRQAKLGRLASIGDVEDNDPPPADGSLDGDVLMPLHSFKKSFKNQARDQARAKHHLLKETLSRQRSLAKLQRLQGSELQQYCERQRATGRTRFKALLHRWVLQGRRDPVYFIGRIIANIAVSLIFGLAFQNVGNDATKIMINIPYLFLMSMVPLMGTSIVTIMHFPMTFNVLLRESINSWYSVTAFYFTRAILDNGMIVIITIIFPNVMWLLAGELQWSGISVPINTVINCLFAITTHHFSYIVAMGGNEESQAQLPFSLAMLHSLFSGFMIPVNSLPLWLRWVQYLYYGQFSYRATALLAYDAMLPEGTEHGGVVKLPCDTPFNAIHPMCAFKTGDQVLENLMKIYPSDGSLAMCIIAVLLYYICFFLLGWLFLALKLQKARKAIARA